MLICVEKATGKLIEMQSNATSGTLIRNALSSGYLAGDIEEREIGVREFKDFTDALPETIARKAAEEQRRADIADALPSWQAVSDAIDGVTTIAGMKVVIKKLARIVYWLAKGKLA